MSLELYLTEVDRNLILQYGININDIDIDRAIQAYEEGVNVQDFADMIGEEFDLQLVNSSTIFGFRKNEILCEV